MRKVAWILAVVLGASVSGGARAQDVCGASCFSVMLYTISPGNYADVTRCQTFIGNDTGEPRIQSVTNVNQMGAASICNNNPAGMGTGTFYFGARRIIGVGTTAACTFQGMTTMGAAFTCVLDEMDGLPVELLDFSVSSAETGPDRSRGR